MRDMPFFTTSNGAASLTLSQIPYTGKAYIRIQDSQNAEEFLQECLSFCRAVGAICVYVTGHPACQAYPEYTKLLTMRADIASIGETDASVFPVSEETLSQWVEIYNKKIVSVPNGAWMTRQKAEEMLKDGDGYFVHRNGTLLGIGKASGYEIQWVASVLPGAGADVVRALCHALADGFVSLTVASENHKAVSLYEKLGFLCTGVLSTWYKL